MAHKPSKYRFSLVDSQTGAKRRIQRFKIHSVLTYSKSGSVHPTLFKDKAVALAFARHERSLGHDARYAGARPFNTLRSRYVKRDAAHLNFIRSMEKSARKGARRRRKFTKPLRRR